MISSLPLNWSTTELLHDFNVFYMCVIFISHQIQNFNLYKLNSAEIIFNGRH